MKKKEKPVVNKINVFLIKSDIKEDKKFLITKGTKKHSLKITDELTADLYTKKNSPHIPVWARYFSDFLDFEEEKLKSSSISAVLVVRSKKRIFVLTFGHGRFLIEPGTYEEDFGLKIALNSVDQKKIRSIDKKIFEANPLLVREQISKEAGIDEFGINVDKDMLRAVTGVPDDEKVGKLVSGMDSIAASVITKIDELPDQLDTFLKKYNDKSYENNYPWINNIREIKDNTTTAKLENLLKKKIHEKDFSNIWLAVPEIIDWQAHNGFSFSSEKGKDSHAELDLETFLGDVKEGTSPDKILMKNIYHHRDDLESADHTWKFFHCLYAEIKDEKQQYILTESKWYRLNDSFVTLVEDYYKNIKSTDIKLPDWPHKGAEATYNKMVVDSDNEQFFLVDKKLIKFPSGHSKIEPCDIYAANKFFHVKKYSGSSVLSHLFSQGLVSSITFLSEPLFREKFDHILPAKFKNPNWKDPPHPADYEIGYVIGSSKKGKIDLPFFSKATLRSAGKQLETYGFKVTCTSVYIKGALDADG